MYSWFDPLTLIRAIGMLSVRRPTVRLFFQGTKHPSVAQMPIVEQSRALAEELGLLGTSVFFNETWVPYEDRQNYLLEADAGVSTHGVHLETALAFRTRILDYLWAALPMVVTTGDTFGELVEREGLGVAVPPDDAEALADALEKTLFDAAFAKRSVTNIRAVRDAFRWQTVLGPLVDYVRDPRPAPDRRLVRRTRSVRLRLVTAHGPVHNARRVLYYLRNGGWSTVASKVRERRDGRATPVTRSS